MSKDMPENITWARTYTPQDFGIMYGDQSPITTEHKGIMFNGAPWEQAGNNTYIRDGWKLAHKGNLAWQITPPEDLLIGTGVVGSLSYISNWLYRLKDL